MTGVDWYTSTIHHIRSKPSKSLTFVGKFVGNIRKHTPRRILPTEGHFTACGINKALFFLLNCVLALFDSGLPLFIHPKPSLWSLVADTLTSTGSIQLHPAPSSLMLIQCKEEKRGQISSTYVCYLTSSSPIFAVRLIIVHLPRPTKHMSQTHN